MPQPSAVAWLDLRRDDLTRAREFIQSLQGEGVLDELGFLALHGQFSDVFYPATSTLMRSARYFYFVAAVYRHLEREKVSSREVALAARRKLDELREALSRNESTGVFGRDAKLDIKVLPSAVYWNGLRLLGMFTSPLSEAGYHTRFDELRAARRGFADDDKTQQITDCVTFWDPAIPAPRFLDEAGAFRSSTRFRLHNSEARDLAGRFKQRFQSSLFVHLLQVGRPDVPFPWAAPKTNAALATYLGHAEALSLLARGTTLQYYALVLEARGRAKFDVPGLNLDGPFSAWWDAARSKLRVWDPRGLAALPAVAEGLRSGERGDVAFFAAWLGRLSACESASAMLGDAAARELVRRRELDVKPAKARLKHRRHLEQWRAPKLGTDIHGIEYRHGIGTSVLREVLEAMETEA
jgi:uncharacterized protein DUF6361